MEGAEFDEEAFFTAIAKSGARVLLIGRQALIMLGIPVLTADYDLWVSFEDFELLNGALAAIELVPNRSPDEIRARGRYVLEGDQHVDVIVARSQTTKLGQTLTFDDAWARSERIAFEGGRATIALPHIDDLVLTKQWAHEAVGPPRKGSSGHSAIVGVEE